MTYSRRGTALVVAAVVALLYGGCSWIVLHSTRSAWTDRISAAENNIKKYRQDIESAGHAARENQLGFIDDIVYARRTSGGLESVFDGVLGNSVKGATDEDAIEVDARDSRDQVLKWSKSQEKATDGIKDIEQDLALLRGEIEEEGF